MARQITSADYFDVDTAPAVVNAPVAVTAWITLTGGAGIDSVVANDPFRLKITRDANLLYVEIKET